MEKGSIVHGFEILENTELPELKARGIYARHRQSGAELFHILNDDEENLFAFAFATAVNNSTGVAHIVEHTVLCGSERYPLKDAFLVLCQGSLQTYLNAWTFPDKTVYPASSVNETDYFNLMAVYADAVFCPRLDEWAFMQEGHRLEFHTGDGKKRPSGSGGRGRGLFSTGVVYNEMKGAYSSFDEYAGHWSVKSVLPDTPYAFESGGEPACIPDLTYEQFCAFHAERYSPANCRVFLAGNIPAEKQLAFLDREYFSRLPAGKPFPPVAPAQRWTERRVITARAPAGGADTKASVFLSWLCPPSSPAEILELQTLAEILLGHDGSPLNRVLVESGLGEDLAACCGLENEIREPVFSVGLRGVTKPAALSVKKNAIEALINDELRRLAENGIPKEDIEAAMLSLEFSNREIRRAGGPYSLVWLRRALRPWIHGGDPASFLLFLPRWTEMKNRLAACPRLFEQRLKQALVDNPHAALVILKPDRSFLKKEEKTAHKKLVQLEKTLSAEEKTAIRDKTAALLAVQKEPDSPENLAKIPHLSLGQLSAEIDRVPRELHDAGGIPVLSNRLWTNGVSYLDFAFPVDVFSPEDYLWLPLFARTITGVGVPGMDYGETASLLARTMGDIHVALRSGGAVPTPPLGGVSGTDGSLDVCGRDWIIFRVKTLDEKLEPSIGLLLRLIREADFNDTRRLRDLILEMKNDADSSLAPAGHSYAITRSARYFSRARAVVELWHGIAQINFIHGLLDRDITVIRDKLITIRETLLTKPGLLVHLTGESEGEAETIIRRDCAVFGAVKPREGSASVEDFAPWFNGVDGKGGGGGVSLLPKCLHPPLCRLGLPRFRYPQRRLARLPIRRKARSATGFPPARYGNRSA